MTTNPLMSILQGEDLNAEAAPAASLPSARATVAASPTLAVVGGQPGQARPVRAPVRTAAGPTEGDAAVAPSAAAREMAQQGAQVAQAPPKFQLPPVDEMVADYQRWSMMASEIGRAHV